MSKKCLTVRIDEEILHKIHIIADYEGRYANSQMLILIRDCINYYEKGTTKYNPKNRNTIKKFI